MKSLLAIVVALSFIFTPLPATAKKEGKEAQKGPHPSERAYERASDNARFKREEGWHDKTGKKEKDGEGQKHKNKEGGKNDREDREEEEALSDTEKEERNGQKNENRSKNRQ